MIGRPSDGDWFAIVGLTLFFAAVSGSIPVVLVSAALAVALASRQLDHGGLTTALAIGLIWTNTMVLAGSDLGAPRLLALAPQFLMAVAFGLRAIARDRSVTVSQPFRIFLWFGAAFFTAGLMAASAPPLTEAFQTFIVEGLVLWFLIINLIDRPEGVDRVLMAIVIGAGVMGAIVVAQFATGTFSHDFAGFAHVGAGEFELLESTDGYVPRLGGAVGEKNRFAQVLVVSLPIALAMAHRWGRRWALICYGSAIFMIAGVASTGSRGAAVGVVAVIVSLAVLRTLPWRAIAVTVVAVVAVLALLPGYGGRVASTADIAGGVGASSEVDGSTLSRVTENLAALDMFVDHPIFGVGPGGYPLQYESYAEFIGLNVRDGLREPHNLLLHLGAELGIIGLATFLVLVGSVVWGLLRARRTVLPTDRISADVLSGLVAAVLAYLTTGVFLHLSFERYLWVLLAVADAAARVTRSCASPSLNTDDDVGQEQAVAAGRPVT